MLLHFSLLLLTALPMCGAMGSGIVGGTEVKPHSRPYMVSVQVNNEHTCGGLLIKQKYVLTAAHCLDDIEISGKNKLEVVVGAHDISRKEPEQQRIHVKNYIPYPCYKKKQRHNDIMLLELKSKAKLNEYVKVLDLPDKSKKKPALKACSIAGWGKTVQKGPASSVLREVTLKLQFNFECKNLWQDYFDTDSMICTISDGQKGFCQGDSGSPLICGNKPQGIAAYTFDGNCINRKYPQVYMKISKYFSWINETIR